jgi:hypothetical protein
MATKNTTQISIAMLGLIAVVVWGFVYFSGRTIVTGPGSTQSQASSNSTLTAGDDALSLQQDLNGLQNDPTLADESQVDILQ